MPRAVAALVLGAVAATVLLVGAGGDEPAAFELRTFPRDEDAYRGLGAWVDVFDYAPAYQDPGVDPLIDPAAVDEMAAAGVRTLFIQATRDDERSPEGIVDRGLLAEFLARAHVRGMRVVGWYLPTFADVERDLDNLVAIREFAVDGERFDGIAVDIEYTEGVTDVDERNRRLVELSTRLREAAGEDVLGAIVLPPVLTEVVNPDFWPEFPWRDIVDAYDVWLPMSYWTQRAPDSGYLDGYTYNEESTRRLRANLGDPDAPVHAIGGIGDAVTRRSLRRFQASIEDTGAVGGSIYDWATLPPELRAQLRTLST